MLENSQTIVSLWLRGTWFTTEQGCGIIETLSGSSITSLQHVYMSVNSQWFGGTEAAAILGDFLARQEELRWLDLSTNYFSSEATEELLSQLAQGPALQTIEEKIRRNTELCLRHAAESRQAPGAAALQGVSGTVEAVAKQ